MKKLTEYHRSKTHPSLLQARLDAERLGIPDVAYQAFRAQFDSAKRRRIDFHLTIEQWWDWWQTDDIDHDCVRWERRGKSKFALVMARFGDVGPYAIDNIYCASQIQNISAIDPAKLGHCQQELARQRKADGYQYWLSGKHGKDHPASRPLITPDGRFESAASAGEHYGITRQAAALRARVQHLGWRWEDTPAVPPVVRAPRPARLPSPAERAVRSQRMTEWHAANDCHLKGKRGDAHPRSKPVITPLGQFGSAALAAEAHGVSRTCIHLRVRRGEPGYHFVTRLGIRDNSI